MLMGCDWLEYDDLKELKYTQWCIKEAMRLYPPVFLSLAKPLKAWSWMGMKSLRECKLALTFVLSIATQTLGRIPTSMTLFVSTLATLKDAIHLLTPPFLVVNETVLDRTFYFYSYTPPTGIRNKDKLRQFRYAQVLKTENIVSLHICVS